LSAELITGAQHHQAGAYTLQRSITEQNTLKLCCADEPAGSEILKKN